MSNQAQDSPLSPQQRHLWRLQADSRAYRSQCAVRLDGPLDAAALRLALAATVARHESLRTGLRRAPGVRFPAPVPAGAEPLWQTTDLADRPAGAQEAAVAELFQQAARRPFDLERGPLVHATLARLGEDRHLLLVGAPTLCADGASLRNLVREVAAAYAGAATAAEPLQYPEAVRWQNEMLESEESRPGREFWREQGRPERFALRLPFESKVAGGFAPDRIEVPLDPALVARAEDLAAACSAAFDDVLLAAWQVLLWRLSGERVGVGVLFDGRPFDELRDAVGLFACWLPLPSRVDPARDFGEMVEKVGADRAEAADWQIAFAADERDMAGLPACFEFAEWEEIPPARGVCFLPLAQIAYAERFKVCLSALRRGGAFALDLHYDTRLLTAEEARSQAERFRILLDHLLIAPGVPVGEIEASTEGDRQRLLEWQGAEVAYPQEICLHRLIEAQVERTPNEVAVTFEGGELTYRQLDQQANRLARRLRELGVAPEARVAVCLERSLDLIVSLLAVLKAGGAYVPLDPGYPPERLAYMLGDAAAGVLVTDERLLSNLVPQGQPASWLPQVLCLDAEREEIARRDAESLPDGAGAGNLAYVIYTSGSTGRPKGAMNIHRAIVNRLLWMQDAYGLTTEDRVLQKTPVSFDVSVWELFWPLLTGARLVVARPGGHQDPAYLVEVIAAAGVTTLHFVPSMLQTFLEASGLEDLTGLRRVICSGEALSPFHVFRFYERLGGAELHNLYGPTEAAVDVTFWACDRERSRQGVPIGRPVANTRIHVLDPTLRPAPPGAPGELCIGGVQVGRGYFGRPELTAEKFVPDPFAGAPGGGRLYRTGDLAHHNADGTIEYLGRLDHQVKVRGFRIELGEIETALAAHPDVREAAVLARDGTIGERRLVAYFVPRERIPNVDELRRFLVAKLPDFMVPAMFVRLDALPLSPNGKLDRAALPAPGSQRPDLEREYVAPRSPLEQSLAEVWAEVLGIDKIGVFDSFFALGGDSIRSVRAVALAKEWGVEMEVEQLFRHQTIAALAEALGGEAETAALAGEDEDLARLVAELEALSEEETQARLREQRVLD